MFTADLYDCINAWVKERLAEVASWQIVYLANFIQAEFTIPIIKALGTDVLRNALPNGCPYPIFTSDSAALSANVIALRILCRRDWM